MSLIGGIKKRVSSAAHTVARKTTQLAKEPVKAGQTAKKALDLWMKDPATRADVERRLRISLALKAVAAKDKLVLRPEKTFEVLEDSAAAFGLTSAQLREALVDPAAASQLQSVAWHLLAVEHVMGKAKVHFEGA